MNWGGVRNGRLLAGAYLIAFPALVTGVLLTLLTQWIGVDSSARGFGIVLFAVGALTITSLSRVLQDQVPARTGGYAKDHRRAWNRLATGRELPGAWRAVKG